MILGETAGYLKKPSGGSGGADVSGVTATAADVLATKKFVTSAGSLVDGTMPSQSQAAAVMPGKTQQTVIPAGTYAANAHVVAGDENLDGANIIKGKSIFNTPGAHECSTPAGYHDTSAVNAVAADVASGKKIVDATGAIITGTHTCGGISVSEHDAIIQGTATSIDNDRVTIIQSRLFHYSPITSANLPYVTEIKAEAFFHSQIENFSAPNCKTFGNDVFGYCNKLPASMVFDSAETLGYQIFGALGTWSSVRTAVFKKLQVIGHQSFSNASKIEKLDFWIAASISTYAFRNTDNLTAIIIRTNAVCALPDINTVFAGTAAVAAGTGYIYVPSAVVNDYKAATNWSAIANQIWAIEDYPEICGG